MQTISNHSKPGRKPMPIFRAAMVTGLTALIAAAPNQGQAAGSYQTLKALVDLGSDPTALIEGTDHFLYGTLSSGGSRWEGVVFRLHTDGSGYEALHSFTGYRGAEDGSWPQGILEASDGALYGTTQTGGHPAGVEYPTGAGTVFKLNKDGSGYSVLHRFPASTNDGVSPWAGLVEGPDKALYGTTLEGGESGAGVIFKINKDGTGYRILHHFRGSESDGARPMSQLIVGGDGWLYGATDAGGGGNGHNGTVFKIKPDGTACSVLHSFPATPTDGRFPRSGLVEGPDGALYGTTQNGGTNDTGTVFKLNRDGTGFRVLHSFTGSLGVKPDPNGLVQGVLNGVPTRFSDQGEGSGPDSLVWGENGILYGTIENLGRNGGGAAFSIKTDGTGFRILHYFPGTEEEGKNPSRGLVFASDHAVYGTTKRSANNNFATLFRISL